MYLPILVLSYVYITFFQVFEVYHFENSSDTLFRTYTDLFLKIKQESSGWPPECSTTQKRRDYIKKYEQREGVKLNYEAIINNPGRRQVAKLALNTLWGR